MQELLRTLEELHRTGKRQAAPFSRREPKARFAKLGRKWRCPIKSIVEPSGLANPNSSAPEVSHINSARGQLFVREDNRKTSPRYSRHPLYRSY